MTNIDSRIVGVWSLRTTKGEDDAGKALPPPYGPKPEGLVTFQADGRMMCVCATAAPNCRRASRGSSCPTPATTLSTARR